MISARQWRNLEGAGPCCVTDNYCLLLNHKQKLNAILKVLSALLILTLFSCTKTSDFTEPETAISKEEVASKVTISKSSNGGSESYGDKGEPSQEFIDSLQLVADAAFSGSGMIDLESQGNVQYKLMECSSGNYRATGINSGGLFSSFAFTYSTDGSSVSNVGLSLQGVAIGWWWSTGSTFTSGLSGTTLGTATYFYGAFTITFNYTMHWTINPSNCSMSYYWT